MSICNTTFNIKTNQMSDGQAFLYGALNELLGGGYGGIGSYGNPFSMGGSLFALSGGYGIGNMYGTPASFYGVSGFSDNYLGMQMGIQGVGIIKNCVMGYLSSRKSEKAAEVKTLNSALETLGIDEVKDFKTVESFDPTKYDGDITTAIDNAKKDLPTSSPDKPEEVIDPETKKPTGKYKYKGTEYSKEEAEHRYNADKEKYDKYEALKNINISTATSESLKDNKLIPKSVIKAFEAREKAEEEYDSAKELVADAYAQYKADNADEEIKDISKNQRKNETLQPLLKAYNAAKKHTTKTSLSNLEQEYKKFDTNTKNNRSNFKDTKDALNAIADWYNTQIDSEKDEELIYISFA